MERLKMFVVVMLCAFLATVNAYAETQSDTASKTQDTSVGEAQKEKKRIIVYRSRSGGSQMSNYRVIYR